MTADEAWWRGRVRRPRLRDDWPLLLPAANLALLGLAGLPVALAYAFAMLSTTAVALAVWALAGRVLIPAAARAFRKWRSRIVIVPEERRLEAARNGAWRVMRLTAVPVGLLGFVAFVTSPAVGAGEDGGVGGVLAASFVPALLMSAIAPVVWAIGESRVRWVDARTRVPHPLQVPWLTRLGVIAAVGYLWRLTATAESAFFAPSALARLVTVAGALVSAYSVFVLPVWVYARVLLDRHADALVRRVRAEPVSVDVQPMDHVE